jgi:hypothetical protein
MGRVLPAGPGCHPPTRHSVPGRIGRALGAVIFLAGAGWPVTASADTAMTAPVVSQQNGAWAGFPLGASPVDTIGSAGCAVSSLVMILNYYGVSIDPAQLNAWLTANNGYATQDDVIWGRIGDASGGRVDFTGWYGADLGLIGDELAAGRPVVAEVRLLGSQHFVVITGAGNGGLIINDPWFGDQVPFASRYGDPATAILSIRTFALRSSSGPRGAGGDPLPLASDATLPHQVQ